MFCDVFFRARKHFLLCCLVAAVVLAVPAFAAGRSLELLRYRAEDGNLEAQVDLARAYLNGSGVAKDRSKALFWYSKAAAGNDPEAQTGLGWLYENGAGVQKDYKTAFGWYKRAAEQGYGHAQRPLGKFYELGLGVGKDLAQAVFWYRKAAEQGISRAQANLGVLYENGQGVARDYGQAVFWYRKSVESGYPRGQYLLGRMYERGLGVERDPAAAREWYKRAAAAKYARAIARLRQLGDGGAEEVGSDQEQDEGEETAAEIRQPSPAAPDAVGEKPEVVGESAPPDKKTIAKGTVPPLPVKMDGLADLSAMDETFAVKKAERHFNAGYKYVQQGQFEKAIKEYEKALALDPGNANTLENLGITLAKTGKMEKGVAVMEEAVTAAPYSASKYASLGIMLHAMEREDAALAQYRMAIRRNPAMAGIYYNMAVLFAARKDYVRAWKSLKMAENLGYDAGELRQRLLKAASEAQLRFPKAEGGWHLRQIVVTSADQAAEVTKALRNGQDFNDLVLHKSLPRYSDNGGYMGFVAQTEMDPKILRVVKRLKPFEVSPAVRVAGEYHIYQRLVLPEDLLTD